MRAPIFSSLVQIVRAFRQVFRFADDSAFVRPRLLRFVREVFEDARCLAGVPREVVDRAAFILKTLEDDHLDETGKPTVPVRPAKKDIARQLSLFVVEDHPVFDEIRRLKIEEMTPLAAFSELNRLRDELNK